MKRYIREAISWNAHPGQEAYVAGFLAARDQIVEWLTHRAELLKEHAELAGKPELSGARALPMLIERIKQFGEEDET